MPRDVRPAMRLSALKRAQCNRGLQGTCPAIDAQTDSVARNRGRRVSERTRARSIGALLRKNAHGVVQRRKLYAGESRDVPR